MIDDRDPPNKRRPGTWMNGGVGMLLWFHVAVLASARAAPLEYTLDIDHGLRLATVASCFGTAPPERLEAPSGGATTLRRARLKNGDEMVRELEVVAAGLILGAASAPACVEYEVSLDGLPAGRRGGRLSYHGKDLLVDPQALLWLPQNFAPADGLSLTYRLPRGFGVSSPGALLRETADGAQTFALRRALARDSRIAFGRFRPQVMVVDGATLRVAVLDGARPVDAEGVLAWIRTGAETLTTLYGRFPVPDLQVIAVPVDHDSDPVPWGQVMRGAGDAVHVYFDYSRTGTELIANWTLYHELAHLLHPFLGPGGAWMSEGLASYYQNVLRARAGLISGKTAWLKLHAGFIRGTRETKAGITLSRATREMMDERLFMRVYWSGAAIALIGDVRLRSATEGRHSLDTTLRELSRCCLPNQQAWTAEQLVRKLDEITDTDIFWQLYQRYYDAAEFPDFAAAYNLLGIQVRGATLEFDEAPRFRVLREQIMTAAPE